MEQEQFKLLLTSWPRIFSKNTEAFWLTKTCLTPKDLRFVPNPETIRFSPKLSMRLTFKWSIWPRTCTAIMWSKLSSWSSRPPTHLRNKTWPEASSPPSILSLFSMPASKTVWTSECTNMVAVLCRDAWRKEPEHKSLNWPTTSSNSWTTWSKTSMETTWSKTFSNLRMPPKTSRFSCKSPRILSDWAKWNSQAM